MGEETLRLLPRPSPTAPPDGTAWDERSLGVVRQVVRKHGAEPRLDEAAADVDVVVEVGELPAVATEPVSTALRRPVFQEGLPTPQFVGEKTEEKASECYVLPLPIFLAVVTDFYSCPRCYFPSPFGLLATS